MKIWLPTFHSLNTSMLEDAFEIVPDSALADICICWKADPPMDIPRDRCIMCQSEPPVASARLAIYPRLAEYHTSFSFRKCGDNVFPFSENYPHLYPYMPWMQLRRTRPDKDLRPTGGGVYFAGKCPPCKDPSAYGGRTIYRLRGKIAATLREALGGRTVGRGWEETTKAHPDGWHVSKMAEIDQHNPDFVLAIENCIMRNYISEKIWDGLMSDRVTLYLGAPNVTDVLDPKSFVNLADWQGPKGYDFPGLITYLKNMTPKVYAAKVKAARAVLDGVGTRPQVEQTKCTQLIIDRIRGAR